MCSYLRVSTDQPAKIVPSAAFCALLDWRMMHQPTYFYWREKAPTTNQPAKKPENLWGHIEIPAVWDFRFTQYCFYWTLPRNSAPSTTSKSGWQKMAHHLTSAATKLFLLGCELVFCRRHPASSGIWWQWLFIRNTQYVFVLDYTVPPVLSIE